MNKLTPLFLVSLISIACGGEPFTGAEFEAIGGEAPAATAGSSGSAQVAGSGGSATVGGAGSGGTTGKPVGGSGAGGAPAACEFDPAQLTAALPEIIVWNDFVHTQGNLCISCKESPCAEIPVQSWGTPVLEDGLWTYRPNLDKSTMSVFVSDQTIDSGGECLQHYECGMDRSDPAVRFDVQMSGDQWVVRSVTMTPFFVSTAPMHQVARGGEGDALIEMAKDVASEMQTSMKGLKFGCDE